ncbi:Rrp15p-domain-containing protein [Hysterangium stoloniferum]|nr:Rrp15p-domain-containing protein [Hysterangium stoloniferum]
MSPPKRPKIDHEPEQEHDESLSEGSVSHSDSASSSPDTDAEIERGQLAKSKKTLKRKRRATSPSRFGATLESLLETSAPDGVAAPLSLKPGIARRQKEEKLERGARKVLEGEKKEREEKGRVRDVIGGWGMEGERALRKVAQRGVITLFNAIQQSQASAKEAAEASRAHRGSGKPSLPAPDPDRNDKTKKKFKANVIGKGKDGGIDQGSFLDMIRSGGVVSKT